MGHLDGLADGDALAAEGRQLRASAASARASFDGAVKDMFVELAGKMGSVPMDYERRGPWGAEWIGWVLGQDFDSGGDGDPVSRPAWLAPDGSCHGGYLKSGPTDYAVGLVRDHEGWEPAQDLLNGTDPAGYERAIERIAAAMKLWALASARADRSAIKPSRGYIPSVLAQLFVLFVGIAGACVAFGGLVVVLMGMVPAGVAMVLVGGLLYVWWLPRRNG